MKVESTSVETASMAGELASDEPWTLDRALCVMRSTSSACLPAERSILSYMVFLKHRKGAALKNSVDLFYLYYMHDVKFAPAQPY